MLDPMTRPPSNTKGAAENPFARYIGAAPAFSSTGEINAWIRELRDEECAASTPPQQPQADD
jgi:hypothetical protein